jgi:hypothetical protein
MVSGGSEGHVTMAQRLLPFSRIGQYLEATEPSVRLHSELLLDLPTRFLRPKSGNDRMKAEV